MRAAVDVGVTHDGSIEGIVEVLLAEQDDVGFSNSISELEVFTEVGDNDDDDDKDGVEDDDNDDEIGGNDEVVELELQGELTFL